MNVKKNKILISMDVLGTALESFLKVLGLEYENVYKEENHLQYCFILNDYCHEIKNIPRIKSNPSKVYEASIESNVRGVFDQSLVDNELVKKLFNGYFDTEKEFNLMEVYALELNNIFVIKAHEYLNIGYFIDLIVTDSYRGGFSYDQIRKYLNQLFEYSFLQMANQGGDFLLEVAYCFTGDVFVIEVSFAIEEFKIQENDFNEMINQTNYCNVNYFKKRQKLSFTSLWFKDDKLKKFRSYFYTEVSEIKSAPAVSAPLVLAIEEKEDVYFIAKKNTQAEEQAEIQGKKLVQARKFAVFIKNYRKNEVDPKELLSLGLADIDWYLSYYPRPDAIVGMSEEVKAFILKLLQEEKLYDGITDYFNKVANSNLDQQVEQIKRILSFKTLADLDEIIRVKGVTAHLPEEVHAVKGWFENPLENVTVENTTQNIENNQAWELKRASLLETLNNEISRVRSEGRNILEEDLIRVFANELKENDPNIAIFVREMVEEAIAKELTQNSKLEEAIPLKLIAEKATSLDMVTKEKFENQMTRLVKIIQQLKSEIAVLKAGPTEDKKDQMVVTDQTDKNFIELKTAVIKSIELIKTKDKLLLKQKTDFEQILEHQNDKYKKLEHRYQSLKDEYQNNKEINSEESFDLLIDQNKNLQSRLDLANQKISTMSDKIDKNDNGSVAKMEKELSVLKTQIQMAQVLIEKFKKERAFVDHKLAQANEINVKLQDEISTLKMQHQQFEHQQNEKSKMATMMEKAFQVTPPSNSEVRETKETLAKDQMITDLQLEKKKFDDKLKVQNMQVKKLEQKLKFTQGQLDELSKRKDQSSSINYKSNEAYVKHLETVSLRASEATNEVAEKKKELLKLKQENRLLLVKIQELEKKSLGFDKKSA